MSVAIILIIIGVVFLLRNSGVISIDWGIIWPLILIALGVYIIFAIRRVSLGWSRVKERIFGRIFR